MSMNETTLRYYELTDNEIVYRARQKGLLRECSRSYSLIDIFVGAGGLTLGFTKSLGQVFVLVWPNDFNAYAACTYNANFVDHFVEAA